MASESIDSSSPKSTKVSAEAGSDGQGSLSHRLNQLKKEIREDRALSVAEGMQKNRKKLYVHVSELESLSDSRKEDSNLRNMLSVRIERPFGKTRGFLERLLDKEHLNGEEEVSSVAFKLPFVEKIQRYTTWVFLHKNQRMSEDQTVVGRRLIYYDKQTSEALICSDSEEETTELFEEKRDFSEGEDRILWMAFQGCSLDESSINLLSQNLNRTPSEIQGRCDMLKEKYAQSEREDMKASKEDGSEGRAICLEKNLPDALDSLDNLFCRRCLVFDCLLHGCSQVMINSCEKQSYTPDPENEGKPCGDQCYLRLRVARNIPESSAGDLLRRSENKIIGSEDPLITSDAAEGGKGSNKSTEQVITGKENVKRSSDHSHSFFHKKQKLLKISILAGMETEGKHSESPKTALDISREDTPGDPLCHNVSGSEIQNDDKGGENISITPKFEELSISKDRLVKARPETDGWKTLEKELYLKGIEIFGRNSCLIARNLLSGLKTCMEVYTYMCNDGEAMPSGSDFGEDNGKAVMDNLVPAKSRLIRRRGRARKLKYSSKSGGHPALWRRRAGGEDKEPKHYTPCGCQPMCGKECPCLVNETCCEKYCGCSRNCKNRFRGCHCAKGQCRSRHCPCFAANRECDPDVCRNCWVSCGDGSLGEPPKQGDGQCGNMRLLLRQQKRILLGKSDVAGWGAFIQDPANKNDYLGEYTGELISHREADKRGKIYDRENSSYLFNLNDQYVLDANRKGDKLKFANHSPNPNCYAKVMFVAGDHRVGIFAKDRIEAGDELFYDYCYVPETAPAWAQRPGSSMRDDSHVPQGRPRKNQSTQHIK